MSDPTAEVLGALSGVLNRIGVGWYVFGAQAVVAWGRPRFTEDVDITVQGTPDQSRALVFALEQGGFALRVPDVDDFVARTWVLPMEHRATGVPVDVVLGASGLEEQFLARARTIEVGGTAVPLISPEDLIVAKLLAGRPKDIDDVVGVIQMQGAELDLVAVRGLLAQLEDVLDQPDLRASLNQAIRRASSGR